jgi:hypothetical protein
MRVGSSRSNSGAAPRKPRLPPLVLLLVSARLALLLPYASAYGYVRGELYYLACARRLAWGYVDHPPLSLALLALTRSLYGESLLAVRLVPAIAGALVVGLTASLAKTFGGGVRAQGLAALAVLVAPGFLASGHVYSTDALDALLWTLAALFLARALSVERGKGGLWWVLLGVAFGLGTENKLSVLAYAGAVVVGLIASPSRALWKTRGPWIAGALGLLLLAPYAMWEQAHGWPTVEFMHATVSQRSSHSLLAFLRGQIVDMLPVSLPLWGGGLWALCVNKRFVKWRPLGVAFGVLWVVFLLDRKSRGEDLEPGYPPLFAAGAVFIDDWLGARWWAHPIYAAALAVGGVVGVPFVVPVLPVFSFVRYAARLGLAPKAEDANGVGPLPKSYASMFGWKEMTSTVAVVYSSLPEEDQREAAIFASNDGEAGAIEMFGPDMGLPTPISGDDSYWFWGSRGASGRVVITVGGDVETWRPRCESVEVAAVFTHSLVLPEENHLRVSICRRTKEPLEALWPEVKRFE